ncbi:MAG: hypothetical protein H6648_05645 [Caldilineae bacterium]|nr:hypothetical protein [Chloroflexota bacterium]MCB9176627.1 hypothetical protein [Caldilineae bacterium]
MSPLRPQSHGPRGRVQAIGTASGALASLFVVLLSVFIYTSRLIRPAEVDGANLRETRWDASNPDPLAHPGSGGASADGSEAGPGEAPPAGLEPSVARGPATEASVLLGDPSTGDDTVLVEDPALGVRIALPRGWQSADFDADDGPLGAADRDLVVEDPATGARMALSAWDARELAPLHLWVMGVASGMRSVDDVWPSNARVAGEDAIALWAPESPIRPASYAVFLAHDGRYYRVAYAARDGGDAIDRFVTALAQLDWLSPAVSASAEADTLPPLPMPAARYFPGQGLSPTR